jgi:hypothetical protein
MTEWAKNSDNSFHSLTMSWLERDLPLLFITSDLSRSETIWHNDDNNILVWAKSIDKDFRPNREWISNIFCNLLAIPIYAFWLPLSAVVFSSASCYAASDLLLIHYCGQWTNRNLTNFKGVQLWTITSYFF